jgi:hypothetical protein
MYIETFRIVKYDITRIIQISKEQYFERINVFSQSVQSPVQCVPVNLAADKTAEA